MPFTPASAAEILAACRQNAAESADALSRALDGKFQFEVEQPLTIDPSQPPDAWNQPGLLVVLKVDEQTAAVAILPDQGGLLPAWCPKPDATGSSKLTTLAQELGMTLLPESLMPLEFFAQHVSDTAAAVRRGGFTGADALSIRLTKEVKTGTLWLLWPATTADDMFKAPASAATWPPATSPVTKEQPATEELNWESLPPYVRSLLHIRVAVAVKLASARQPLKQIIELGPGSILQFNQSCEQPLRLCVGDQEIAEGEAVKVNDKFGLRVTNMILPGEKFVPLRKSDSNNSRRRA